ncbi:GGDEF domain-containing protein [Oceanidesulfovibrio indonesiensis]|uniref:diguanylate cyclase n=1 Tax=Oceanidesulfovibrio indonesiensis TaxID=54767 RepID=A0A7M3MCT2_9BACT|nr:GGDEF domain-containing protein [Oceanidesulfovibrio indonesiensis]TVM15847.1 GGDEF domain-containing protein [Oceanidesulfovibrio indonesiensis]
MKKDQRAPLRTHCDFCSNGEKICETLDKAGVPADGRWRTLMLYMRGMQEYEFLPDQQKARLQSLVLDTLRRQDFSEESYRAILRTKQEIIHESTQLHLQSALQKTARLVNEFGELLMKRKQEVERLGNKAVSLIASEEYDPEDLVGRIRSSFQDVVTAMEKDASHLSELSRTDSLTGIANRRVFDEELAEACFVWSTLGHPFSLIMLDIDHFKHFNDTYGHRIGDQALTTVASLLKEYGKQFEAESESPFIPARYGGEEFAVILPGAALDDAMDAAEAILGKIRTYGFIIRDAGGAVIDRNIRLTVSAGVAEALPEWTGNIAERVLDAADKALYTAKREGRNRARQYIEGMM